MKKRDAQKDAKVLEKHQNKLVRPWADPFWEGSSPFSRICPIGEGASGRISPISLACGQARRSDRSTAMLEQVAAEHRVYTLVLVACGGCFELNMIVMYGSVKRITCHA